MIRRIEEFIKYQGISVRAFEQAISASDGMIRRAINNGTDIQSKWITKIADNYPQLNLDWLITGEGKMLKCDNNSINHQSPNDSILLKLLEEKEKKIEKLTEELRAMERKVGSLEAELRHVATLGNRTADNVSTAKRSSQSRAFAHSASAPSNE